MCGILGIVMRPGHPVDLSPAEISRMRDVMAARGPDGSGTEQRDSVAFAHRRLAIRDRTGGVQPLVADDQQSMLVYNGELYNDGELRKVLGGAGFRFQTKCDTEVVLAAFRHWGAECVHRLRGMYAFAVYDFRQDTLTLVRDRFGVKPLYFADVQGSFVFASSIACILAHPRFQTLPNWSAISHYFSTFRLTLARETLYQGIQQLLPGEILELRNCEYLVTRYWDYPADGDASIDYAEAVDELDSQLDEAVKVRLASDVPVGLLLSGGVDSNTIACKASSQQSTTMLARCGGGTLPAPDFEFASRCARTNRLDYGEVRVDPDQYRNDWRELIREYRTPLTTPSDVIIYNLAKEMKRSVGVVLEGKERTSYCADMKSNIGRATTTTVNLRCGGASGDTALRPPTSLSPD